MKPTDEGDVFILSTGREVYASGGYIGINCALALSHGYDGHIYDHGGSWTPDERRELADYMIGLWTTFRDKADEEPED